MNINILKIAFFILIVLASMSAMAQNYPDYVITVKGDSIPCRITDPDFSKARYQDSLMATPEKITPDRIKEFYISDLLRLYRAVYIEGDKLPTYLIRVEKGTINLYYYSYYTQYGTVVKWFAGKDWADHVDDFNVVFLSETKTKKQLKNKFALLLKDNPQVLNKFTTDDDFDYGYIVKMVHLYNTGERYDRTSNGTISNSGRSYIVTPKNDTVYCSIKNDYFTGKYMFKLSKENTYTTIDSTNTGEFFYSRDTSHFVLVNEPGLPVKTFVKQLEKGRVNFYQKTLLSNDLVLKELQSNLYISKGNSPLTLIGSRPNSARKFEIKYAQLKIFFDAIADNADLLLSFKKAIGNSATGKEDVIRYFIQNYNFLNTANSAPGQAAN